MTHTPSHTRLTINATIASYTETLCTPAALAFIEELAARFMPRVTALLAARQERQAWLDAGNMLDFLPETLPIRQTPWQAAPIPSILQNRRVEIVAPAERHAMITALNSGAQVFMADCEDGLSPSWANIMQAQLNLYEAVRGTLSWRAANGYEHKLHTKTAILMMRPRGWHLPEKHVCYDGQAIAGTLWDAGLYLFHNSHALLAKNAAPYLYLPKLEHYQEAELWHDIFVFTQEYLGLPYGTIRATAMIETLPAAFQMDEIIHALRDHIVGLNCGRWDYIFSFIKCFRRHPTFVLPEREQVTMRRHFLHSYSRLLIQTCHRRGIHALGGMAAQIPDPADPLINDQIMSIVRADKEREVQDGHDGTWVGHPDLVMIARDVFDHYMPTPNQIDWQRASHTMVAADLLQIPPGTITATGVRTNISVALHYIAAWLGGEGCVDLNHMLEDAATAEISRVQLWQWLRHPKGIVSTGERITLAFCETVVAEELAKQRQQMGDEAFAASHYPAAAAIVRESLTARELPDYFTLAAYQKFL